MLPTNIDDQKIISTYFEDYTKLSQLPKKEKRKKVILNYIIKNHFKSGITYSEKEINAILKNIYEDFVTLRRDLIDYNFMNRSNDGSSYWL